jgi:hypothetical protein
VRAPKANAYAERFVGTYNRQPSSATGQSPHHAI